MDVTNPGLVNVESETYGNPDPNGGTTLAVPFQSDDLVPAADEGYPKPQNDVQSRVFPTFGNLLVDELPFLAPSSSTPAPRAAEFDVDAQVLGQGTWVWVDPADHAKGMVFVEPSDFTVVGPAESFQTNLVEDEVATVTVTAVLDADNLPHPPSPTTTRYYLVTAPPRLTSYAVSLLGRQVTFSDDTLTAADRGASRAIQNYGPSFVVINRDDVTTNNGNVPALATPQAGDTFEVAVNRQGSEQVNTEGGTVDVFISPPPPNFVPTAAPPAAATVDADVSTGPQPGQVVITSGVAVPTAVDVSVPDQPPPVGPGLPAEIYV